MKYSTLFQTHQEYESFVSGETMVKPNISYCINEDEMHYNKIPNYLRFTALEDGSTLQLKKYDEDSEQELTPTVDIEYSWDGINFTGYDYSELEFSEGETVYLCGNNSNGFSTYNADDDYTFHFFVTKGLFECHGNVMSLLYGEDFETSVNALVIPNNNCYFYMFSKCTSLITPPELPATTLTTGCYSGMFNGCTSLTSAPELPATTLTNSCYSGMFNDCTSLTSAPELPATTLAEYCYDGMFFGCTNLTTPPELPATILAANCYSYMFYGTNLTVAPELPATILAEYCYYSMFYNCTNLTSTPKLPATTLVSNCYWRMFHGCTNLNYIKAMFISTPGAAYTYEWIKGVASSGTFVKNAAATWNVIGNNGIPSGWTVQTATE